MRATYHVYHLKDTDNGTRYILDIKNIINAAVNENIAFRNGFMIGNDHLYLFCEDINNAPDTFFFLITRDNELVKTINNQNLSLEDIRNKISTNEKIGMGSFVHVYNDGNKNCVAFAAQILSPKITQFWDYINEYLRKIGCPENYQIIGSPLAAKSNFHELMNMDFIGKTAIQINRHHSKFSAIKEFLGSEEDFDEVEGIEVIIKPKRNKNIKSIVAGTNDLLEGGNVDKFTARAKGEAYATLTDLYIIGNGGLFDDLNVKHKSVNKVRDAIGTKIRDNQKLHQILREYYNDPGYDGTVPSNFSQIITDRLNRTNTTQ